MPSQVALVTGGCGCVGFHIVKALLQDSDFLSIHVFSRKPTKNLLPGVAYHAGNISSDEDVKALFSAVQPTVVFHVASPASEGSSNGFKYFYNANVTGTMNLLEYSNKSRSTRMFIYTSSVSVCAPPLHFATEDCPLKSFKDFNYYSTTKAIAETAVLQANDRTRLLTCALRITPIYGERDSQMIPGLLQSLQVGFNMIRFASDKVLMDVTSANNAATAHILAYKALKRTISDSTSDKADGEAFFITNGTPLPPWTVLRKVWAAAGDQTPEAELWWVPAWFLVGLGTMLEWLFWIFTFGTRTPPDFRSHSFRWINEERTFSIQKARERLGGV
ncbi:NAD(P)-binding protein [Acephala macrosclerotiorum]|nr:NAD(P)-binding protein [Acephala macrosclerotiorum]